MDGAPTLTLMDSIGTALADPAFDHGSPAASSSAPEQLQWTLGSELEQSLLRSRGWQRQGGTYESATTRRFFKGQTGFVRVVTRESDAFVQAMLAAEGADKRKALFEQAAKVHVANAQAAGRGEGIDRHFLGERTAAGNSLSFLGLMACCAAACVVVWD